MKKLLLLFLLIVAVSAAAPGFLGMQAERRYAAAVHQLEAAGYRVAQRTYARGWFTSNARLQLEAPLPDRGTGAASPPTVLIRTHAVHGPFLGDADAFFGLARLDSEIWLGAEPLVIGDAEPALQTRIGLLGATRTAVRIPARRVSFDGGTLETSPVVGHLVFGAGEQVAAGEVSLPSLRLQGADGPVGEVAGLRLEVDLKRGPAGVPVGGWRFAMQRATLGAPAEAKGLAVDVLEVSASSEARDGTIDAAADYRVRAVTVEGQSYGPLDMRLTVRRLPADALARVQAAADEVAAMAATPEERGQALAIALLANADALLAKDPAVALDHFALDTPQGRVEAALELRAVGLTATQFRDAAAALRRIEGKASLRLPEALLDAMLRQQALHEMARLAEQQGEATGQPSAQEREDAAGQYAAQQIETLVAQQILARDGEAVALAALLRNGLLTVNGKTIPLEMPGRPAAP